jgi:hypothetical protein
VTEARAPVTTDEAAPIRPARPAAVELAGAILIVGGAIQLILAIATLPRVAPGAEPVAALALALNVASIAVGLLVRLGRAWLMALNFAAVLGFLDLLGGGGSPLSLMLGVAEVLVVLILLAQRPWFDAMRAWRAESERLTRA